MAEVAYLGHKVGSGCLKPEPAKVEATRDWLVPQTNKQVQAFTGLAEYYQRFVPHFSSIRELCEKWKPDKVVWPTQCQGTLCALKEALGRATVLVKPDFEKPFIVFTNASDVGLGSVLMQVLCTVSSPDVIVGHDGLPTAPSELWKCW
ncbi:uncharacterized protein LOC142025309 [Carettochelys insculpta]|uniref:uncharacterized protein LOC142025309 n=1 Tax=Carettochelys insculpta TaxID=44489 RepID=UPI003EB82F48